MNEISMLKYTSSDKEQDFGDKDTYMSDVLTQNTVMLLIHRKKVSSKWNEYECSNDNGSLEMSQLDFHNSKISIFNSPFTYTMRRM